MVVPPATIARFKTVHAARRMAAEARATSPPVVRGLIPHRNSIS
jgi:hypothetical protein